MKNDVLIQNNVIKELKWEPSVDASKIGVVSKRWHSNPEWLCGYFH